MRKTLIGLLSLSAIVIAACNNSSDKSKDHNMSEMGKDSPSMPAATDNKGVKTVAVTYPDVDSRITASINEIVDHYLHVKNALVDGNAAEAAKGSKAMGTALSKIDKSLFTAGQKKLFDDVEDDLKEHTEHIADSPLDHQREHFAMMSKDVYDLAKAFGGGRTLYHDHCPMYNDNKGAMWLSEMKEVKNPYYGNKMMTCGTVEEIIK